MYCAICHHPMNHPTEPVVCTTVGSFVHIRCADREALSAYRVRTHRVVLTTALALGLLGLATCAQVGVIAFLALLTILAAAHIRLNQHWWRLTLSRRCQGRH